MAKKFGKFVLFSALAGAAAAGTYFYLQKKQDDPLKDIDDIDDFDDFDDDFDDDTEDTPSSDSSHGKNRSYVSLDLDSAKEIIGEKVIETIDKTKEKIENFNVSEKLDKAKEIIEEMTQPAEAATEGTAESSPEETSVTSAQTDASAKEEAPSSSEGSVSSTYSTEEDNSDTEEFFDDTDEED